MESGSSPLFRRSLTTVSMGRNRPSVATSWLNGLINTGNSSPVDSPLKPGLTPTRKSVQFELEDSKNEQISSWISTLNAKTKEVPVPVRKTKRFATQIVQAQKSPLGGWISSLVRKVAATESPEAMIKRLVDERPIADWVKEIASKENSDLKEPLKNALCEIIDQVYRVEEEKEEEAISPVKETPRPSLSEQIKNRLSQGSYAGRTSVNCEFQPKSTQRLSVSSFSVRSSDPRHNKTYSFSKQTRNIDFAHRQSPGPAHYDYSTTSFSAKPTAIFVTDKTTRYEFLGSNDSPGPADYNPSKESVSK